MDEDGLPLMGSGIDLTKVPAIQQKRTVAFLNQFVVHTVQFLNRFSTVCEEKLSALSLRIQQIETTLNILDAKLSSIPGLEDVKFEISTANVSGVTNGPEAPTGQHSSVSPQSEQKSVQGPFPQLFPTPSPSSPCPRLWPGLGLLSGAMECYLHSVFEKLM
ncbi:WASH complex subunit 3 isoform X4 [Petaurus breviceps papuanus]|uniref:WASH complex subunit 3 isoform X4 n=1 Tax=Petaurus breviceps papuanus TaxID=3040969 RepID=UPI0036DF4B74